MIARNISFKERTIFGRTLFYDIVHLHYSYKRTKKLRVREMLIPTFLFLYNKPIKLKDSKMKKVRAKALYIARYLKAFALYLCFTLRPAIFNSATRRWPLVQGVWGLLEKLEFLIFILFSKSSAWFRLVPSISGFPPAKVQWLLILALQKGPLTEGGEL